MRPRSTESGGRAARWWPRRWPRRAPAPLVVVCPQIGPGRRPDRRSGAVHAHWCPSGFRPGNRCPANGQLHDAVSGDRLRVLKQMQGPQPPKLLVTSIQALLQPVPDREALARQTRRCRVGAALVAGGVGPLAGGERLSQHDGGGTAGRVFRARRESSTSLPPTGPIRCAWNFSATRSNRSAASRYPASGAWQAWTAVDVTVLGAGGFSDRAHLADYLPPQSWFLLVEPEEMEAQGRHYLERLDASAGLPRRARRAASRLSRFPSVSGRRPWRPARWKPPAG